ncbi:hypothetical protein FNH22_07115 [Fulvivirga sp. M361]|uniref:hypothetical protein n=1 Tax=Fulvivirga sp. M361 TaxID=2594266 RepID=UPI00117AAA03|nr:hypothetical protein [Fulvivirga sp. M361]TRX60804.1 hypothetical protein FNH22_07115 [Fulvivirga sp. M361]
MEDAFKFEKREGYLYVEAEGVRKDLTSIVEGTKKIQDSIVKYGTPYVLADYRKVRFNVPLTEAYNIIKIYESKIPEFSTIIMAGVINPGSREIAQFWQSICDKRGYTFKVFHDIKPAETWISGVIQGKLTP